MINNNFLFNTGKKIYADGQIILVGNSGGDLYKNANWYSRTPHSNNIYGIAINKKG